MINRRNVLVGIGGLIGLSITGITLANTIELSEPSKLLIEVIDRWKEHTKEPIYLYDDPNIYRMRRHGIYYFFKNLKEIKIGSRGSVDWIIDSYPNSDIVLREVVNHYNGKIINTYKEKIAYQTPGYIMGIKV
jgi:hypothetical protein